ncbi:hypothetical protein C7999DRAFT_18329 [Corynascus novoguineensis]|uniref:Uncharacterized protein n=1 Tax=Corynascus novoguineensis TaxID=1126955 RepID=A0AAN7HKD4_9PEZI|nr:hypothetical protein C7999DRAFT_18329 [Corynascus novoguineensis]
MFEDDQLELNLVQEASTKDAAIIVRILADGGIPTALGGIMAATLYGGGLCPLDIELIVNDADQHRAFDLLTSRGAQPSVPDTEAEEPAASFERWRELAPSYQFSDRRRVRLCVPMYELPRTGDPIDDALRPFVILYSAETVGLPAVHFPSTGETAFESGYTPISSLASVYSNASTSLVPTFPCLVASEMHVLFHHADYLSPTWGQHVAQLSELLRSRSCDGGYDSLPELVNSELREFAGWMRSHLQDGADGEGLARLKEAYTDGSSLQDSATGMVIDDDGSI